jgi:hypothetical protein
MQHIKIALTNINKITLFLLTNIGNKITLLLFCKRG